MQAANLRQQSDEVLGCVSNKIYNGVETLVG